MKPISSKTPRQPARSTSKIAALHRGDLTLFGISLFLLFIGVVFVYEASLVEAYHQFNDKFYFAKHQLRWAILGIIAFITSSLIDPKWLKKLSLPLMITSLLLLILVLIPGVGSNIKGASRWLNFGLFTLQPSELTKISLVIYLATLFEKRTKTAPFVLTWVVVIALIMLQPDLGTAIIISLTAFTLFFLSGGSLLHFFAILLVSVASALILIFSSPYRKARLLTFLDPQSDPLGAAYHIRQIIIALGSGGFFGTGFGRSLQKYRYLPEATTDSIFAVIAEETGFFGSSVIILTFTVLALKGLQIARFAPNRFLSLLAAGTTAIIVYQAFLNLGAMTALVPLTGITLPFISYGGSSLLVTLFSAGLLYNISRFTPRT